MRKRTMLSASEKTMSADLRAVMAGSMEPSRWPASMARSNISMKQS